MTALLLVMLALVNGARHAQHAAPLRVDPVLVTAARRKAADVARCGFRHDACGLKWWAYLPRWRALGECLEGANVSGPAATVRAWLRSPHHRALLLDPTYTRVGFARDHGYYVAELSS